MVTMKNNPLSDFTTHPHFAAIAPSQVQAAVEQALAASQARVDAVVAAAEQFWEAVVAPLEAAEESVARVWNQVEQMHAVVNTPAWRDAYRDSLQQITAYYAALGQHEGLHARLKSFSESAAFAALSAARQKIVIESLQDFELSGVALPPPARQTFRQNSEQLAMLAASFEQNLLAATNDFSLLIRDEGELGEMPADLRAIAKTAEGWCFTLQAPSYMAFMTYVTSSALREEMYRAYNTRASDCGPSERDNTPLIGDILEKREQQAALLGFSHYADMALQRRMAPSVAAVNDFLRNLITRALPHAKRELDELRQFAAVDLGIADLQAWDVTYASEKLRRRRYDFSDADLRPYLREDKVLEGLFACVKRLFKVEARRASVSVWREDVVYYELVTVDGAVIGGLYMDLYARDDKRGGAWMADALSRCRRNGALQLPLAHVNCNFAKPVAAGAALLNWDEMTTLFHEFGHALHHLLTEMEDYSVSGISGVEWDAVELPSQWLENFVWDWRVLRPMTAHIDDGSPMPRALFDKVTGARRFQSGMWLMRQLEFALLDLTLHSGIKGRSYRQVWEDVRAVTAVLPLPSYNRFPCSFSHIFAGGYAAGYYSYLWSEMLSADIFALFAESEEVLNPALGERFRREVLSVGGSRAAMDSFVAMSGRQPDMAMLLRHYGLADGQSPC